MESKIQEAIDHDAEKERRAWESFIHFLAMEFFGPEVHDYFQSGRLAETPEISPTDEPLPVVVLKDFEWGLWRLLKASVAYRSDHGFKITQGKHILLDYAEKAVSEFFWQRVHLNEISFQTECLGVRKGGPPHGFQIVAAKPTEELKRKARVPHFATPLVMKCNSKEEFDKIMGDLQAGKLPIFPTE